MHEPESVLENTTHKIFWDTEKQTDHLISVRKPALMIINKKIAYQIVDFQIVKQNKKKGKRNKYLDLVRELKIYGAWRWRWYQL